MKTKLLKKARKRFSIVHYPKGYISNGIHFKNNTFKLFDARKDSYYSPYRILVTVNSINSDAKNFNTEQEAINYLKSYIINILRDEGHKQRKDNEIIKAYKKVWYV